MVGFDLKAAEACGRFLANQYTKCNEWVSEFLNLDLVGVSRQHSSRLPETFTPSPTRTMSRWPSAPTQAYLEVEEKRQLYSAPKEPRRPLGGTAPRFLRTPMDQIHVDRVTERGSEWMKEGWGEWMSKTENERNVEKEGYSREERGQSCELEPPCGYFVKCSSRDKAPVNVRLFCKRKKKFSNFTYKHGYKFLFDIQSLIAPEGITCTMSIFPSLKVCYI